ncbi:MAG TPA: helix-turn-helix transcriptional regulator [Ktedonobacteraceae bacterium]|nr:helix-turn-helix transcriptional regulator [Ktedonobacteraceae bacterium]
MTIKPQKYPNRLKQAIKESGYTIEGIAAETDIPVRTLFDYCAGRVPVPKDRLNLLAHALGYPTDYLLLKTAKEEEKVRADTEDQVSTSEKERLTLSVHKAGHLQEWLIDSIEDGTHLRWQLYYTSRNTLTNDGLRGQITKLEFLADEGKEDCERICRVLAQNYQLAGSLARDKFQYSAAKDYFSKAKKVIDVEAVPDMGATAIARHALVYLRQGQNHLGKALRLYKDAATVATHATHHVRAYVLSGLAEAHARNGDKDECYRLLDQADQYLNPSQGMPLEEDSAYVYPTLQSLEDARGECYVLLGEVDKGLHYLQSAQKQLDQKISRNRCRLLMQHAEAFFVSGQPDQCVKYTIEGLQLARMIESASNIHWSYEIYDKLRFSAWKNERAVKELEEVLKG